MNSYTTELLDQFKAQNGIESDYAAAKELGVRPNRLSNYRTGVSHADDRTAVMLADALGLDRLQTIARINMDRARDKNEKAFWRGIATAAALAMVSLFVALPGQANASTSADLNGHTPYALCEVFTDGFARRLARLWRDGPPHGGGGTGEVVTSRQVMLLLRPNSTRSAKVTSFPDSSVGQELVIDLPGDAVTFSTMVPAQEMSQRYLSPPQQMSHLYLTKLMRYRALSTACRGLMQRCL